MGELMQDETSIKLYEDPQIKPDIDDVLAHHGILGMRWGKKNGPPYPLGSDKSTGKRLKSTSGRIARKRKKALKKARKVRAANQKRKLKEQQNLEATNKSKEEIIKTKDIKAMSKNIDQFSNQEINDMLTRLDTEKRLREKVIQIEKANTSKGKRLKDFVKENVKSGAKAGVSSVLKTVSKNAIKMGSKKLVKEMVGEENKELQDMIDKLFKEEKK